MFATLAEFECDLIRERTASGLAAARARGRHGGRPAVMTADKLQAARQSTRTEAGSSGGAPSTVVPETPTATPPSLTVVPPVDLAPMPEEPTVLPGQDASAAEERQRPAPPDLLP